MESRTELSKLSQAINGVGVGLFAVLLVILIMLVLPLALGIGMMVIVVNRATPNHREPMYQAAAFGYLLAGVAGTFFWLPWLMTNWGVF
jgi:hypothetical protein